MISLIRYGLGPHENYPDRLASAWLGVHTQPLERMHTAYVVPSENGGRGGVRWLAVRAPNTAPGEEGEGEGEGGGLLLATGPLTPPLQASVSAYSVGALTEAKHERELRPDVVPPNTALHRPLRTSPSPTPMRTRTLMETLIRTPGEGCAPNSRVRRRSSRRRVGSSPSSARAAVARAPMSTGRVRLMASDDL